MKIPNRWLNYKESALINGTRFIAFKTPLREGYSTALPANKRKVMEQPVVSRPDMDYYEYFTPRQLLQKHSNIKLVIDLTFTTKYYDATKEFEENGVRHIKIKCTGHKIPQEEDFRKFLITVAEFIATNPEDRLIGVHCTHGVNRTGYFIVRYMIERLRYTPQIALREFCKSRGHAIERTEYIRELLKKKSRRKKFV